MACERDEFFHSNNAVLGLSGQWLSGQWRRLDVLVRPQYREVMRQQRVLGGLLLSPEPNPM